jgi:hypothetical protein
MYIQIVSLVAQAIKALFERVVRNTPSLHNIRDVDGAIRPNER